MNECLIPYPESEQARRILLKVCVSQHGEALLDALCQDREKSIEEQVKNWLVKKILPALEGRPHQFHALLETEAKADRLPVSELRDNLISLFVNEFCETKTGKGNGPQRLLSRKLEGALEDLCQHGQRLEGEVEAFKVLSKVISQYFYAANADNSDQPRNMANIEQAVRELERRTMRDPDDHKRMRLLNQYQDAGRLTDALWVYFAEHSGLKDVKTKEKLLDYVLQLPRFHQTDENMEILARHIPELGCPDYNDVFLCFSRLPREEREALEIKLGVVIEAGGICHRDSLVKFINKKALREHYGISAETLRQRFNSAARRLAHCLWDRIEESNDA